MGAIPKDPTKSNRTFTIVVGVLVVLTSLPVLGIVLLSTSVVDDHLAPTGAILGVLFAAIPVVPLVYAFLWLDRYEPEPKSLLALGLGWGAFVAVAAALIVQSVGALVAGWSQATQLAIVAPVTEEAAKGLFLLVLLVWRRHLLDGVLDGIVYAGMVGIGFAFTENILYLGGTYNGTPGMGDSSTGHLGEFTAVFVMRCLFSPFAHPLFTAFIGIGIGVAVVTRKRWLKVVAPLLGFAAGVLAHGTWNGSTLLYDGAGFLLAYVVVMVPAFVSMVIFAVWRRKSERIVLTRSLTDAAQRGLIPYTDIDWVVDLRRREQARKFAAAHGGARGVAVMREYQQAAIELGYLHWRFLRGNPPPDFAARGRAYVDRISEVRPHIAFPNGKVMSG
ncbi:PrsW family intramembrane metalloprotease [Nocardioides panzhihuensis]|uniref:RsiW-degrading membrane proteinase PrsW (M82 family) n=1 Tax=Nocardioides panzhihuensis TaxID=860243 RepID=A0A7Z0IQF3_9ACTN|nr:PrsW family intramembrane metalloprotease [Nocardioides panzhihuensis]NYI75592.1 RsiW-degrading membrane proteinase PrsW (M82 family) [Nocardioides panzhihuensis]